MEALKKAAAPFGQLATYLRESKEELEKVSWPSRQDTVRYVALVIGTCVVVALSTAALDAGLTNGLEWLVAAARA
jgi:preprotein translocase subunit SecE